MDCCGYLKRPLYADLIGKYLVSRLAESDMTLDSELNVLSTGFSVDQLLGQDFLQVVSELGG